MVIQINFVERKRHYKQQISHSLLQEHSLAPLNHIFLQCAMGETDQVEEVCVCLDIYENMFVLLCLQVWAGNMRVCHYAGFITSCLMTRLIITNLLRRRVTQGILWGPVGVNVCVWLCV